MFGVMKISIANAVPPSTRFLPARDDVVDMEAISAIEELDGITLGGKNTSTLEQGGWRGRRGWS
jgi:hypothetical protein